MMKEELRLLLWCVAVVTSLAMASPGLAVTDTAYQDTIDAANPIAWYRMDDATDSSGNLHNATATGGVTFAQPGDPLTGAVNDGDTSGAALFDGTSGVMTVPNDAALNFGCDTDFTIEGWAKTSATGVRTIVNKGDSNHAYWLRFETNGTLRFMLDYGKQSAKAQTTTTYKDDQWHHVVGVANRSIDVKLYVDGELAATGVDLGRGSVSSSLDQTIGQLAGAQVVNGWLDEVAVYNSSLSLSQVQTHYYSGYGYGSSYDVVVTADSPVAWYRMADASDSADSHNGTAGSGVTFGQTTVIAGDTTGSALLDGTANAVITVPQDAAFDFGSETDFAVEAWIKLVGTSLTQSAMIWNDGDTDAGSWLRIQTDGTPRFLLDFGSTALDVQGSTSLLDEAWHHIVGVANRETGLQLYVDGALADEDFNGGDVTSTLDLQIGKLGTGSYMSGPMDEVAIYNRALSDAEVRDHYKKSFSIPEPGVLALALAGMFMWLAAGRKR